MSFIPYMPFDMNTLENYADLILLSSDEIEHQIESYKLIFSQYRNNEVEWKMKFPMFVPPFYDAVLKNKKIPSQKEYWNFYIFSNKMFFSSNAFSSEILNGLQARIYRTYPSLVRDIHFAKSLIKKAVFDKVFYNPMVDIEYGIDLILVKSGKLIGINLFTKTQAAQFARKVKEFRPKKKVDFKCLEIPVNFKGGKKCGDFFLCSEREIVEILNSIV